MYTEASLAVPLEDPLELVLPLLLVLPLVDPLPLLLVLPLEVLLPPLVEPPLLPPEEPPLVLPLVTSSPAPPSPEAPDESPQAAGRKAKAAKLAAAKKCSAREAVRSFGIAVPLDQELENSPNSRHEEERVRQMLPVRARGEAFESAHSCVGSQGVTAYTCPVLLAA
jgi:hypothetical protein